MRIAGPLATCLLAILCTPATAQTPSQSWDFRVYLDDSEIGSHRFTLTGQDGERTMVSDAHFKVKLLFVNVYSYNHTARERWRGKCLSSMEAQTRDGGKSSTVTASLQGERLEVSSPQPTQSLAGCVMSFAYWDPAMLQQQRLLNAQTGAYDAVTIRKLGRTERLVRGVKTPADHYRLVSDALRIDLWYSPAGEWLALESLVKDGKRLRYELG